MRDEHVAQCLERTLGTVFLDEADHCVEQNHGKYYQGSLQLAGNQESNHGGRKKYEDQEVFELADETLPGRDANCSGELVGAVVCETGSDLRR